jgi:hypothetical protein
MIFPQLEQIITNENKRKQKQLLLRFTIQVFVKIISFIALLTTFSLGSLVGNYLYHTYFK